jgi:hypothetical protein
MNSGPERLGLPCVESFFAAGALQADSAVKAVLLEHAFDPLCHAWLADVMQRLAPMRDFVAKNYAIVALKHKLFVGNLDQRVSTALGNFLLRFSQAVCHAEVLLLKGMQPGVVREETVLRLEQLVVDLAHRKSDLIEVSKTDGSLFDVSGSRY